MSKRNLWLVKAAVLTVVASLFVRVSPFVTAAAADGSRSSARSGYDSGRNVGEVLLDGRVVLRVRTSAGGLSPYERAQTVSRRLDEAMAAGMRPDEIHSAQWGNEAVILGGNNLLFTVDSDHARFNHTTPMRLADTWGNNLAGAMGGHRGNRAQYNPHGNSNDGNHYYHRDNWRN